MVLSVVLVAVVQVWVLLFLTDQLRDCKILVQAVAEKQIERVMLLVTAVQVLLLLGTQFN
jgi:hypothetical protein